MKTSYGRMTPGPMITGIRRLISELNDPLALRWEEVNILLVVMDNKLSVF